MKNWNKAFAANYEDDISEMQESMKTAASSLSRAIPISELIAITKLYAVYQLGDDKFYKRLNDIILYKLPKMTEGEVVSSYLNISLISCNPSITVDFSKLLTMASYKILKSMHSLTPAQIANVVYAIGMTRKGNKKLMKSYKSTINRKLPHFNTDCCHKILIGWLQSGMYVIDDQDFCNRLLLRIIENVQELKNEQLTKLMYNLYGKNLAALEFEYQPELEELIYEKCHEFEFPQIVQVLATFKFMGKDITDERFEQALENYLEKLIPTEVSYLLRYFYNDKVNMGLSSKIQEKLEQIILEEAEEMNSDELSVTYSALALAKKSSPELLEYLEGNLSQKKNEFTIDTILYLLNLKSQGNADFLNIDKIAAPAALKLLKQRNFSAKQYTTLVLLFTANQYYDQEFWKEVLSYLDQIELPDAISYMQLHSSLSVVNQKIDIGKELKLLE